MTPQQRAGARRQTSSGLPPGGGRETLGLETRFERLELKYLVGELTADRIRRDIEPYCEPDEHNPARSDQRGYEISSLYLDSPGLVFHRAKMRGDAERLKLRVRTYSKSLPALLELKRKSSDVIDKSRVAVDRKQVEEAAAGLAAPMEDSPEARRFLSDFGRIVAESGAGPTLHVRYEREAYTSAVDTYARVTFDRRIGTRRTESWDLDSDTREWCEFDHYWRPELADRSVVLEFKCQSAVPHWMGDLVRRHSLDRTTFSKYSIGIHLTGRVNGERRHSTRSARPMG